VSATAIVWLVIVVAWIVVLVLVAGQALRAVREALRLRRRVGGYRDLPLLAAAERASEDVQRLERTAAEAEPLLLRAQDAIEVIRRGPLPPEVIDAFRLVRDELAAFRRLRAG
jgi:hypothetical protein